MPLTYHRALVFCGVAHGAYSLASPTIPAAEYDDNDFYEPHSNYYYYTEEGGDNAMQSDLLPSHMQSVCPQPLSSHSPRYELYPTVGPQLLRGPGLDDASGVRSSQLLLSSAIHLHSSTCWFFILLSHSRHTALLIQIFLILAGAFVPFFSSITTCIPTLRQTPPPLPTSFPQTCARTSRSARRHLSLFLPQGSTFLKTFKGTIRLCRWRTRQARGESLGTGIVRYIGQLGRMARAMCSEGLRARHPSFHALYPIANSSIADFRLMHQAAFGAVEQWSRLRHPNIVHLHEAFTTRAFGDNCLYPLSL